MLVKDVVAAWKKKEGQDDEADAPSSAAGVLKEDRNGTISTTSMVLGAVAMVLIAVLVARRS